MTRRDLAARLERLASLPPGRLAAGRLAHKLPARFRARLALARLTATHGDLAGAAPVFQREKLDPLIEQAAGRVPGALVELDRCPAAGSWPSWASETLDPDAEASATAHADRCSACAGRAQQALLHELSRRVQRGIADERRALGLPEGEPFGPRQTGQGGVDPLDLDPAPM